MALQSEVSPHLVGDPNKDTQIEGDTKSDEDSSSLSTDDDVDLEEGEILDSAGEEEKKEKKDLTNSSLKEALDKNMLMSIEQLVSQAKSDTSVPVANKTVSPHSSPHKVKKRSSKYLDRDIYENCSDNDGGWYSPSRKSKSSKYDGSKPIDYRKELEAYRGTPPSSPDSTKHRDKKKKRSKKSKKSTKKIIKRKDIRGMKVRQYLKESIRHKLCKFFKDGNCAKGSDCAFSHASPHSYKKKELCKFYLSGHCNKGKGCTYMHGEFPCKFYHTGSECYAKDNCRFSHAPLTDEMKQILADYLRISRDEDFDRKRRCSPSPERIKKGPPPKRTCLLGSPPRHIREAEETKRWQEEMLQHQHDNPAFKINVSPSRDNESSPPFAKANFYQDTLLCTPKKRHNAEAPNNSRTSSFPSKPSSSGPGYETYSRSSPSDNFVYEEDYQDLDDEVVNIKQEPPEVPEYNWTNMCSVDHNSPPIKTEVESFADSAQQELDFTNDVKFDETTQFSEMESSIECSASSPSNSSQNVAIKKENGAESPNLEAVKSEDKNNDDSNSAQESIATPIIIPSHLPKKQQELFKRIFQHQKKTEMAASASDASNSPKHYDNSEPLEKETEDVKEKSETEKSEPSTWFSSEEDDDDDSDEPLTDVLKKLQKEPPSMKPPVKIEARAPDNILALLNKVTQLEKKQAASESQQNDFIKNLLSGKIPSNSNAQSISMPVSEPRRTLLPDPKVSIKKEPLVAPKDPRLKKRDPRTLPTTVNNVLNLPKTLEQTILQTSCSIVTQENKITISNSASTVISEAIKEDIPYKLRGIYTKPPNYTPYINASQINPNLLKDPRLRKHLTNQNSENGIEIKKNEAPPIPKLLLTYDKFEPINIFESSSSKPHIEEKPNVKPIRCKLEDPRMKRRNSQNSSGSNTPPHLIAVDNVLPPLVKTNENIKIKEEKKWSPPLLEKAWNHPTVEHTENITIKQEVENITVNQEVENIAIKQEVENVEIKQEVENIRIKQETDSDTDDPLRLEIDESPLSSSKNVTRTSLKLKKSAPTPASHLPRAIADPRMARLHGPLDSRRLRVGSYESTSKNLELKKNISPNENLTDSSKTSPPDNTLLECELKAEKTIPKKKSSKSDEKKKTIHRNRKSSMDYASPLNSCDDSNSNKSLNYNSYNQRPPRTIAAYAIPDSNNSMNSVSESTPDFLSDNSNLDCDNSSDVNVKDKFKTIDPTASPFC